MTTKSFRSFFKHILNVSALLALATGLWLLSIPASHAAFPGTNGEIAFTSYRDGNGEIYVMNADGTSQTNLTNHPAEDNSPAWSPDGTQIAFTSYRDGNGEIYVMNADGTGQTRLTNHPFGDIGPSWSPDGTKIVFSRDPGGSGEVYEMNADGTGQTNLTNNGANDANPSYSPDGTKIVFYSNRDGNFEIYVMNADGTGQTRLTNNPATEATPAFSPDGTKIAFYSDRDGNVEVYEMNADGTDQTNLSNNSATDFEPDWQPVTIVDSDGDGVPDDEDECPDSDLSATVVIDGCNSGVTNTLFASGCTISDLSAACAEGASNHGQFVSCVSHVTNGLKKAGTITGQQKGAIQSCAAKAHIP